MLFLSAYPKTWPMCLATVLFFAVAVGLTLRVRVPRLDRALPARPLFWGLVVAWLVLMSLLLTLIDKPHFALSGEAKNWTFMFSAFLGVPVTVPLLAGAVWALNHHLLRKTVRLSGLVLLAIGAWGLGCAASNIHDVLWCGVITDGYSKSFEAGYDLDLFVAFGECFGIEGKILADYVVLGPYALLLVAGELAVATAAFIRLGRVGTGAVDS